MPARYIAVNRTNNGKEDTGPPLHAENINNTTAIDRGMAAMRPDTLGERAYSIRRDEPARYADEMIGPASDAASNDANGMRTAAPSAQYESGTRRLRKSDTEAATSRAMTIATIATPTAVSGIIDTIGASRILGVSYCMQY